MALKPFRNCCDIQRIYGRETISKYSSQSELSRGPHTFPYTTQTEVSRPRPSPRQLWRNVVHGTIQRVLYGSPTRLCCCYHSGADRADLVSLRGHLGNPCAKCAHRNLTGLMQI